MRVKPRSLTLPLALLCAASLVLVGSPRAQEAPPTEASANQIRRAKNLLKAEAKARTGFDRARALLRAKQVPFDPDLLRRMHWRKLLAPTFDQMPEMQTVRRGGAQIKGVLLAHTLYLPEQVEVVGDAVIIVRNLIYEGRNVRVAGGGGSLYVYSIERVGLLGTTLEEALKKSPVEFVNAAHGSTPRGFTLPPLIQGGEIVVDRSSYTVGSAGSPGSDGHPAANAVPQTAGRGQDGICGISPHGEAGNLAGDGGEGNQGWTGGAGGPGALAQSIYHDIPDVPSGTTYSFRAVGGKGGPGWQGGQGSAGGQGGNGGSGGDGADCPCAQGGAGRGGNGQNGGNGGRGGRGGNGGRGGDGGQGGNIEVTYTGNPLITTLASGGEGGDPGQPGSPGIPGTGGSPGNGGRGASNDQCPSSTSSNGRDGQNGGGLGFGPNGEFGPRGDEGAPGLVVVRRRSDAEPEQELSCGNLRCDNFPQSPIVIDVDGDGFDLTDAAGGVLFDLNRDAKTERLSWTAAESDDAWLALDRDGNGLIDDGTELFGNFTFQRAAKDRNGFLALKEFDYPSAGGAGKDGNGDGRINSADGVFSMLLLWHDANHNGVSEADELSPLSAAGVEAIELDYKESKRTDEHGNRFRYRAKVRDARGEDVGRWAWDVFLVRGQ